jgi:glutaredoxin
MTKTIWIFLLAASLSGCTSSRPDTSADTTSETEEKPEPPVVTDEREGLLLSWFVDGGPETASKVSDVPQGSRHSVRIQDTMVPPEKRKANWLFLADLRTPDPDGHYPVRVEPRDKYEVRRRQAAANRMAQQLKQAQQATPGSVAPNTPPGTFAVAGAPVVMYSTNHCPVCKKARRWLLDQQIPYIEKDINKDRTAASELAEKGAAQGVPTNGVPVFEIGGRLIPGFDPGTIRRLLGTLQAPKQTI